MFRFDSLGGVSSVKKVKNTSLDLLQVDLFRTIAEKENRRKMKDCRDKRTFLFDLDTNKSVSL